MELTLSLTHLHVERDKEWIEAAQQYLHWKKERMLGEAREQEWLDKLKALSQGIASKGGGYVFTPEFRKGNVDYKSIPELRGVDLERYRKNGVEVWKLTYEVSTAEE